MLPHSEKRYFILPHDRVKEFIEHIRHLGMTYGDVTIVSRYGVRCAIFPVWRKL